MHAARTTPVAKNATMILAIFGARLAMVETDGVNRHQTPPRVAAVRRSRAWRTSIARQNLSEFPRIVGEGAERDVVAMQHREIEVAERAFRLMLDEAAVAQAKV